MRFTTLSRLSVVLGVLALSSNAYGQMMCSLGPMVLGQPGPNPYLDQPPSPRASDELRDIYDLLCPNGCGNYLLASNPTVPNAMAIATGHGQTKIVYAPQFMNGVVQQFGPAATFGILAHEFGHHIDFHTTPPWMNNAWTLELKADAWAGCALARAGIGTAPIQTALQAIAAYPSPSHPGWPQRQQAVRTGFANCGGQWSNQFSTPSPPRATFCQTSTFSCPLAVNLAGGDICACYVPDQFGQQIPYPGVAR